MTHGDGPRRDHARLTVKYTPSTTRYFGAFVTKGYISAHT